MILETITLQNFGPYRNETIDLRGITSGTVCGTNGAGKSSGFLDAPLWALFGKCRIHPDKMITLGETDMSVALVFRLDQRYRVTRTRSIRTKAGKSDLHFQVQNGETWSPIGGKSVTDTQAAIDRVIQASYDVCTSTNFLVQGQFDQVSKASPAQRKALLCDILGVSRYAEYAVQSRMLGSRADGALTRLVAELDEVQQDAAQHQAAVVAFEEADQNCRVVQARLKEEEAKQHTRQTQKATIEGTLIAMPVDQSADLETRVRDLTEACVSLEKIRADQSAMMGCEPTLVSAEQELALLNQKLADLKAQRLNLGKRCHALDAEYQELQDRQTSLQVREAHAQHSKAALEVELRSLNERIQEYEQVIEDAHDRASTVQHLQNLEESKSALAEALDKSNQALEIVDHKIQEAQASVSDARAQHEGAKRDIESAKQQISQWVDRYQKETKTLEEQCAQAERKANLLVTVPCSVDLQRQCGFTRDALATQEVELPALRANLAERVTDPEQIAKLSPYVLQPLLSAESDHSAKLNQATMWLEKFRGEQVEGRRTRDRIHTDLKAMDQSIADTRKTIPDVAYLEKAHADLPGLKTAVEEKEGAFLNLIANLAVLAQSIAGVPVAEKKEERAAGLRTLHELDAQIDQVDTRVTSLRDAVANRPAVDHAKAALPATVKELEAKEAELQKARVALHEEQARVAKRDELMQHVSSLARDMESGATSLSVLADSLQDLTHEKVEQQAVITRTSQAGHRLHDLCKQRDVLKTDIQDYAWLTEAYKRTPILMLENAIPVLEDEANRILEKISASGMRLHIETQKALKSKDELVDTVDIVVRDRVGERPYEAFSGGERMRLDLALRLSLSKLIATRSGSKIQTLIIDEAFAPLDEDGISRMRSCLAFLEQAYPLVLVITHDDDLRDSLGAQIVVAPGAQGSTVAITT